MRIRSLSAAQVVLLLGALGVARAQPDGGASPDAGASATAAVRIDEAPVRAHGRTAFEVKAARGGTPAVERARAASAILTSILDRPGALPSVTIEPLDADLFAGEEVPGGVGEAVLRVGGADVLLIGPPDVAASGLPRNVYFESLRASVETFVTRERRRATLQEHVLAVAMAVFLGLVSLFALRWAHRQGARARSWVELRGGSAGLHVRELQVLSPQAVKSALYLLVAVAALLAQVAIVYAYLAYSLSQFDATRGWVPRLSATVISPFTVLIDRLGIALPAAILLIVGAYVVLAALHVVGFFLEHVARGDVRWQWLPKDLAAAMRPVARAAIVVFALVALGPIVGGASDGTLSRIGLLALGTIALASVPLIATMAIGTTVLFGRRLQLGEWVSIGGHVGEVTEVTFLDVCLVPVGAGRVRVPHLFSLMTAVHHLPGPPLLEVIVPVGVSRSPSEVIGILERAAATETEPAEIELASLSPMGASYRVRLAGATADGQGALLRRIAEALFAAGIPLGAEEAAKPMAAIAIDPPAREQSEGG